MAETYSFFVCCGTLFLHFSLLLFGGDVIFCLHIFRGWISFRDFFFRPVYISASVYCFFFCSDLFFCLFFVLFRDFVLALLVVVWQRFILGVFFAYFRGMDLFWGLFLSPCWYFLCIFYCFFPGRNLFFVVFSSFVAALCSCTFCCFA